MIDNQKFRDVMITHILPLLENNELVAVYNTSHILRSFVLSFRNWQRAYDRVFPCESVVNGSFEQYIKRFNAKITGLPRKPIRDLVASRFLMAALGFDGQVYIGPNWRCVPQFRADRIWASSNHLYALDSNQLYMWKFLDMLPTPISHQLELNAATIVRSGASLHA